MSKLEKFLSKASELEPRKEIEVTIDGDVWKVRQMTLSESRICEREADKGDKFDWYRYNDARIVKSTEHDFNWNDPELKKAYKAGDKFELPAKLFDRNPNGYAALLEAVRNINSGNTEADAVEEAKN
ncbi:phage tail assembly chaperone [Brevibacillus laterosporus]|uniref:phage tail assembly chaperone n=1 Tax=Brevibacillus laterosporus TaxID=1465 RepID=UPI003D1A80C1